MSDKKTVQLWKLILYPLVTFLIIFAISRSMIPLLKDWTWKATVVGCGCGFIAAFTHLIILLIRKE